MGLKNSNKANEIIARGKRGRKRGRRENKGGGESWGEGLKNSNKVNQISARKGKRQEKKNSNVNQTSGSKGNRINL